MVKSYEDLSGYRDPTDEEWEKVKVWFRNKTRNFGLVNILYLFVVFLSVMSLVLLLSLPKTNDKVACLVAWIVITAVDVRFIYFITNTKRLYKDASVMIPDRKFSVLDCKAVDLRCKRSTSSNSNRYTYDYYMKVMDMNGVKCRKEFHIDKGEFDKFKLDNRCLVIKIGKLYEYMGVSE